MWQRIQTVWLLLAALCMVLLFFFPIAHVGDYELSSLFLYQEDNVLRVMWELAALDALVVVLALLTIVLFKKRKMQMHLCIFNILLTIGYGILVFFLGFRFSDKIQQEGLNFGLVPTVWLLLPVLSIFFFILAFRNIRKDEILIRMSNRLR